MGVQTKRWPRRWIGLALLLLLLGAGTRALQVGLDAKSLHDAYVLGQRNDKSTADFLAPYLRQVMEPQAGPHIAEVELLTPFAQVVDESRRRVAGGFSEEQSATDYHQRGDTVLVNILLLLPSVVPSNGETQSSEAAQEQKTAIDPENFWQNFKFSLKQNGKNVPSRSVENKAIRSTPMKDAPSVLDGENVWLKFDVRDLVQEIATVEVLTPEGKTIRTDFDLKKLR